MIARAPIRANKHALMHSVAWVRNPSAQRNVLAPAVEKEMRGVARIHLGAHHTHMRTLSDIRRLLLLALGLVCVVCVSGCEDNPSSAGFGLDIELEQPLTLDWAGKAQGEPFTSRGTFAARASHRVEWRLEVTAVPRDPDDPRFNYAASREEPRFATNISFQERLLFAWDVGRTLGTRWHFAIGDTCTAKVTASPSLAATEAQKAVFRFVVGGGELPDE